MKMFAHDVLFKVLICYPTYYIRIWENIEISVFEYETLVRIDRSIDKENKYF